MKPIAIIQHTDVGAPGAIGPILGSLGRATETFRLFRGDPIPEDASHYAGIVVLGGSMGVHDKLPWIPQELALLRAADRLGLPLAGHCLGSQMLAFALGGSVARHTRAEIGWQNIETRNDAIAQEWLGAFAGRSVCTFQWHQDTFSAPAGADQLARGAHCDSQAFVVAGRHLLVQSHLEITPELVEATLEKNRAQLLRELDRGNRAAQPERDMLENLAGRTADANRVLARLYARWVRGCRD
jgi:GMP synthase-like glutamine amidotransferase